MNEIALPHLQNPRTVMRIISARDRLQGHCALPDLLHNAVRPSRAIALEKLPEADALAQHPELAPVYRRRCIRHLPTLHPNCLKTRKGRRLAFKPL